MKTLKLISALLILSAFSAKAECISSKVIEDGGTGPYKAVMTVESGLEGFAIYRPENLAAAAKAEGKALPVALFGNGGCATNSKGYYNFLSELASHGYIIVSQEQEEKPAAPGQGFSMTDSNFINKQKESGLSLLSALEFLQKESTNKNSIFYQAVDAANATAMGQSCGGLQALAIGVTGDERIKSLTILNSGITKEGDGLGGFLKKSELKNIKVPMAYICGGPSDIAYKNGKDDFMQITHVPVVFANYDAGHMATYGQSHGGTFAQFTLAWLDYTLKGKKENETIFKDCKTNDFSGWYVQSKNFTFAEKIFDLDLDGNETTLINDADNVTYNSVGDIEVISGCTTPAIRVYLPTEELNTGTAVVICSGGAMRFHSWGNDVESMAKWLNSKGIAVIGLKYTVAKAGEKNEAPKMPSFTPPANAQGAAQAAAPQGAAPQFPAGGFSFGKSFGSNITGFANLEKANANPDASGDNEVIDKAIQDAINTIKLVRKNAEKWNIDPKKVGILGYSAGGGVAIGATVRADEESMPSFLATCYGPSLIDVTVPENAPDLFVATRAEHPNVAAGCLALFMEWKKAGKNAEMYIYDDGTMGFAPDDRGTTSGTWRDSFFRFLVSRELTSDTPNMEYAMKKMFQSMGGGFPTQK